MKRMILIVFLIGVLARVQLFSCTTAVISGKFTKDHRPLLWKHRDSGFLQNKLMYFSDGTYDYIGLVNSVDSLGKEVWAGSNSAGFAIMNAASYNLNIGDTTKLKDREGVLMKKALQQCATLQDFEQLLTDWPKPMGIEANFGVIDARGGAAYYETGNFTFTKIDANDPSVAPFGYIIRTNYSVTGKNNTGYGYIRFRTASELFNQAMAKGEISDRYILQKVDRSLFHSLTGTDLLKKGDKLSDKEDCFVPFQDYIPRYSSCATFLVHGVRTGQDVRQLTIWTLLGFQLTSVAVPVWIRGAQSIPSLLRANEKGVAPLCDLALKLKERCFPVKRGSGKKYLNLPAVWNQEGSGILQQLLPVENQIFHRTDQFLGRHKKGKISLKQLQTFYKRLTSLISSGYKNILSKEE